MPKVRKICKYCGKIFEVKRKRKDTAKFCSQKCYDKFRMKDAEIKKCLICGKKFRVIAARKKSAKYCSNKCRYKSRKGENYRSPAVRKMQTCLQCGKTFKMRVYQIENGKGKYCSKECYSLALRQIMLGKNNYAWIDGRSFEPYPPEFNSILKRMIRESYNYICQSCGQYGNTVHHIDYDKKNCNPDNLINLCRDCNIKVNVNREYWKQYFQNLIYEHSQHQLQFV